MKNLSQPVLVLNRDYRVLRTVSAKMAIIGLFKGVVEVIDVRDGDYYSYSYEEWIDYSTDSNINRMNYNWIHSVRFSLAIPYIIRIKNYAGYKRNVIRFSRKNVYLRDRYTCQYTGKKMKAKDLTLDHVVPKSKGGKTEWTNIVACAKEVNAKKGSKTLEEAGLKLLKRPKQPDFIEFYPSRVMHESWKEFLKE